MCVRMWFQASWQIGLQTTQSWLSNKTSWNTEHRVVVIDWFGSRRHRNHRICGSWFSFTSRQIKWGPNTVLTVLLTHTLFDLAYTRITLNHVSLLASLVPLKQRFSIPVPPPPPSSAHFVCFSFCFRRLFYSKVSALRRGHHRIFHHDSSSKRTYVFHSKCIELCETWI